MGGIAYKRFNKVISRASCSLANMWQCKDEGINLLGPWTLKETRGSLHFNCRWQPAFKPLYKICQCKATCIKLCFLSLSIYSNLYIKKIYLSTFKRLMQYFDVSIILNSEIEFKQKFKYDQWPLYGIAHHYTLTLNGGLTETNYPATNKYFVLKNLNPSKGLNP